LGGELRVKITVAGNTVTVTGPVPVTTGLLESVALTVTVVAPAVVGVPVIVQPVSESPAGKVPDVIVQA
jgi:hypothetical protein